MRALFYSFVIKNGFGYFAERNSNVLIEYNLSEKKIERMLDLKEYYSRNKAIAEIDIRNNNIILYPSWSDAVQVVDLVEWKVKKTIRLDEALYDGLWCDFRPIFVDSESEDIVYLYRGREKCRIYELNTIDGQLNQCFFTGEIDEKMFGGYGEAYVSKNEVVCMTSYQKSDNLAVISIKNKDIKYFATGCGNIKTVIFKNDLYWIANDIGELFVWSSEDGIIQKIIFPDLRDQYKELDISIFDIQNGILVGGVYRDGSYLTIGEDYKSKRIVIPGLDYKQSDSRCEDLINIRQTLAYNRSIIQMENGTFVIGDDLFHVYDPINVPYEIMGMTIAAETDGYSLKDYINDII